MELCGHLRETQTREGVRSPQSQSQNRLRQVSMKKGAHENCSDGIVAVEGKSD